MVEYVGGPNPQSTGSFSKTSAKENAKCLILCSLVAISTFQYGFDTGIVNGFQAMQGFLRVFGTPGPNPDIFIIGTVFQQLITSLLQVGLICGSLLLGPLSRFLGRRAVFFVASVISIVSITIQITVTSKGPIYVARCLMGVANGLYVNLVVLYISETTPAHLRGAMVSVFQPFTNIGGMIAAVISNALSTNFSKVSYQVQLGILYVIPVWLAIYVIFIPETPRWLASQGRDDEAEKSLKRLRGKGADQKALQEELFAIKESIRLERELSQGADWREIFQRTNLRRTVLCTACATFHAATGINFVRHLYYFFQIAGTTKPFINTIIYQSCGVATSLAAVPLTRIFERRHILLTGFSLTTLTMFLIAILYTVDPHSTNAGKAMVAMVCLFGGAYGGTIGPLSWAVAGELPTNRLRSYTFGFAMAIGFVFAWLTTFTTPYFINTSQLNWGPKIAWIWFPSNLVTLIFVFFTLPETKGRTLEELDELFLQRIPPRQFKRLCPIHDLWHDI
ncbi:general substrate transporter [Ramaria rubella]|nr:general substrate transporter [Ramaria rubella]